jgi:hypothetical protein
MSAEDLEEAVRLFFSSHPDLQAPTEDDPEADPEAEEE